MAETMESTPEACREEPTENHVSRGFDGPLLLTLLMGNNNNNAEAQKQAATPPAAAATVLPERGLARAILAHDFPSSAGPIFCQLSSKNANESQGHARRSKGSRLKQSTAAPVAAATLGSGSHLSSSVNASNSHRLARGASESRLERSLTEDEVGINEDQVSFFNKNGYVILPRVINEEALAIFLRESRRLVEMAGSGGKGTRDIALEREAHHPSLVGKIVAAFEPGASVTYKAGSFSIPTRHVARLGCGIHVAHPLYRSLTFSNFVRNVVKHLGLKDPRVTQSLLHAKQRSGIKDTGHSGICQPHQDGWVSFTDPGTCVTFWCALENATRDGGCLRVAPGSHLSTPIKKHLGKNKRGWPSPETLPKPVYPLGVECPDHEMRPEDHEYIPLEVKAGDIVLMQGGLLHKSGRNLTAASRFAYSFSIIDGSQEQYDSNILRPDDGAEFEKLGPVE